MNVSEKRKRLVDEVFSATGAKMEPDDPLVLAALYYSQEMRNAGDAVSGQLLAAATELRSAADLGAKDRTKLMRDIEGHIVRCAKAASARQAGPPPLGYVPTWYAVLGAVVGAILLAAAWKIGTEHGSTRSDEAAVGRAFAKAVQGMEPKLRQQIKEHLQRNQD